MWTLHINYNFHSDRKLHNGLFKAHRHLSESTAGRAALHMHGSRLKGEESCSLLLALMPLCNLLPLHIVSSCLESPFPIPNQESQEHRAEREYVPFKPRDPCGEYARAMCHSSVSSGQAQNNPAALHNKSHHRLPVGGSELRRSTEFRLQPREKATWTSRFLHLYLLNGLSG